MFLFFDNLGKTCPIFLNTCPYRFSYIGLFRNYNLNECKDRFTS